MKNYIFLLFIICVPYQSMAEICSEQTLEGTRASQAYVKKNYSTMELEDVESLLNGIKFDISRCDNATEAEFGFDENVYNALLRSWFEEFKGRIEHLSNFTLPEKEIEKLQEIASQIEADPNELDRFIQFHQDRGNRSMERERNDCSYANLLRTEKFRETRDQGTTGWGYAFTGADLISYRLDRKVSALGLALAYNDQHWSIKDEESPPLVEEPPSSSVFSFFQNIFEFGEDSQIYEADKRDGNTKLALEAALKQGLCFENELSSEDNWVGDTYNSLLEIERFKRNRKATDLSLGEKPCRSQFDLANSIFKQIDINKFVEIFNESLDTEYLDRLTEKSCSQYKPQINFQIQEFQAENPINLQNQQDLFRAIDFQLKRENPVSIDYDATTFQDRYHRISSKQDVSKKHASTVVGKSFNSLTGECEYLIRNSSGSNCDFSEGSDYSCSRGYVRVPKSSLAGVVYGVTYIE